MNKVNKAFIIIFIIGLMLSLITSIQLYVLNSQYQRPDWDKLYSVILEYVLFSLIAFIFPVCWKGGAENKVLRVIIGCLLFSISYLAIMSTVEWLVSGMYFRFWSGFAFTIMHSGLQVIFTYILISLALVWLGIVDGAGSHLTTLKVRNKERSYVLEVKEVAFFEANDNYVNVTTSDAKKHLVRQTLSNLESKLDDSHFQRIHRKYIVNLAFVDAWKSDSNGGYLVFLKGEQTLKMSKTYSSKLQILLEKK